METVQIVVASGVMGFIVGMLFIAWLLHEPQEEFDFMNKLEEDLEKARPKVEFSRRVSYGTIEGIRFCEKEFLAYKDGESWRGLVGYEEFKETADKVDMLMEHLKLMVVPAVVEKKPAHLEKSK